VGGQAKVGGTSTRIVHKLVGRVQELWASSGLSDLWILCQANTVHWFNGWACLPQGLANVWCTNSCAAGWRVGALWLSLAFQAQGLSRPWI